MKSTGRRFTKTLLFCFCAVCVFIECNGDNCPSRFVQHTVFKNMCYLFENQVTFTAANQAVSYCENLNATVANIYNQRILHFINSHIESMGPPSAPMAISVQDVGPQIISSYSSLADIWTVFSYSSGCFLVCEYIVTGYSPNIMLLDGTSDSNGRLVIFQDNLWRSVCLYSTGNIDGIEGVCSMLGYRAGRILTPNEVSKPAYTALAEVSSCSSDASDLSDCQFQTMSVTCGINELIGLTCDKGHCPDGFIRHRYYNNTCYHTNLNATASNIYDATLYCRRFNSKPAFIYNMVQIEFIKEYLESLQDTPDLVLIDLAIGSEYRFPWFHKTMWTDRYTYLRKYEREWSITTGNSSAAILCEYTEEADVTTNVALVDGTYERTGRVELYHNGRWASICSASTPNISAIAGVCKVLGFGSAQILNKDEFKQGNGEILNQTLECRVNSAEQYECSLYNPESHCNHDKDIGLYCFVKDNGELPKLYKKKNSPVFTTKSMNNHRQSAKAIGWVMSFITLVVIVVVFLLPRKEVMKKRFKSRSAQTRGTEDATPTTTEVSNETKTPHEMNGGSNPGISIETFELQQQNNILSNQNVRTDTVARAKAKFRQKQKALGKKSAW